MITGNCIPLSGLKLLPAVFVDRFLKLSLCLSICKKGTLITLIAVRIRERNVGRTLDRGPSS